MRIGEFSTFFRREDARLRSDDLGRLRHPNQVIAVCVSRRPAPQRELGRGRSESQESSFPLSAVQLGASLYLPATRPDLLAVASGRRLPELRSVIFCTEDAVHGRDLERALGNLAALLPKLEPGPLLRFVRPRNPTVLWRQSDGIVAAVAVGRHRADSRVRAAQIRAAHLGGLATGVGRQQGPSSVADLGTLLPILETVETFDHRKMEIMRDRLEDYGLKDRILCLRIGGNDLLNLLGIRRSRGATIYDTPLRGTIADLVRIFHPAGYRLSAPVFDYLDAPEVLAREVEADLQHGLVGKTAIHPSQIPVIESCYRVPREDYETAAAVLAPDAAAVFRLCDSFCEPATHRRWADGVLERARVFGVGG